MTIWKKKGWYRISIENQEDVSFHENAIEDIYEALNIIRDLQKTWHFSEYHLDLRKEV